MKSIKEQNKGITLIALIVTIIVLLILAGVSLAMLTGENGTIAQANNAKESSRGGEVQETVNLTVAENRMANYTSGTKKSRAEVIQELYDNGKLTDKEVEELKSSNVIKIGSITIDFSGLEDDTLPLPENAVISQITGEYEDIDNGIVIYIMKDADGDGDIDEPNWNNVEYMQTTYDQFVWVPVENAVLDLSNDETALSSNENIKSAVQSEIDEGRYPMAIKKDTGDYMGVLYQFSLDSETNTVKVEPYSDWTPLDNAYYREPSAVADDTYLPQINGILNTNYTDSTSFGEELQSEFNKMVEQVSKNHGFWVGRYETSGMSNSTTETYASSNEIKVNVVKGTTTGISSVTWYRMYAQQILYSKLTLGSTTKMTSSMIWGSQWDQIMIWMKDIKNDTSYAGSTLYYILNSRGMGNFATSVGGTGEIANTGYYAVKNVYDLAGNIYEWTLEAMNTSSRVIRGGSYFSTEFSDNKASGWWVYMVEYAIGDELGSRITLY
jgi:FlaG/FlaF family flagellin (archaellin)